MRKNEIDSIVFAMGCTLKLMPDPAYAISEDEIISRLNLLDSIHKKDAEGRTLLMYAAMYDRYDVLQYLLAQKVDIHAKDRNQYSALHFAVQADNVSTIKALIDAGADVNAKDRFGNNPLMRCNNGTSISTFELLLKNGANPLQENVYGMSAKDVFSTREAVVELIKKFAY